MQTLIENVNIINPFEEINANQNVLIEDGMIKRISSSRIKAKRNANVVDGEDNYLMPGFIDCHAHIFAKGFHKESNRNPEMRAECVYNFPVQWLARRDSTMKMLQLIFS